VLDLQKPVSGQGTFHLIVCKLNTEMAKEKAGDPTAALVLKNIGEYAETHPNVPFIDSVPAQRIIMDRINMTKIFNNISISLPELASITSAVFTSDSHSDQMLSDFPFPAVAKSIEAGGSHASHEMGIVFNKDNLSAFKRPVLLQQFHNHNSVIYKVYATADSVSADVRPSLPNFEASPSVPPLLFNSQAFSELHGTKGITKAPTEELLKKIAHQVSLETGLTVFGFDLIYCVKIDKYCIIDINFFPGYHGIESFPHDFVNLIKAKISKAESQKQL